MDKDFNDKIRASFEESAPKAPEGIWEALDGAMSSSDQQMDAQVKGAFAAEEAQAPEGVWAGINRQLTIDQAWVGINRYLNRRIAWMWTQRVAALALLTLAIYYGSEQWPNSTSPSNYIDLDLRDLEVPESPQAADEPKMLIQELEEEPAKSQESLSSKATGGGGGSINSADIYSSEYPSQRTLSNEAKNPAEEIIPMGLNERSWNYLALVLPDLKRPYLNLDWQVSAPPRMKRKSLWQQFSIGFEYSYNRDFLSNNIYRESQDPRSLVRSNPVYSNNYKLVLHYHLQERWSLKLGFQPQRAFRLDYNTFREGQYVREQMALHYSRIGLGLEHHKSFNSPFGITLGVEPYYALLTAVEGDLRWRDYDDAYGLQLRLGADWHTGPLVFSLGFESDFNFNNLYLGNARIPSEFDRTLYRSWGLYVGSRYRFF